MTRQEQIGWMAHLCDYAGCYSVEAEIAVDNNWADDAYHNTMLAASVGAKALDHLAALEQQAVQDYLADVPLPEGWTEEDCHVCFRYWEVIAGIDHPVERVYASDIIVRVIPHLAHWPAIPQAVLVRAAVQCGRLREAGR